MAVRLSKLVDRDVVAIAEGRTLGRPHSILIDPDQHRVAVIVMVPSHVRELTVVARARSVKSFESDTIALEALSSLRLAAHDEMALDLLAGRVTFLGREALSSHGHRLGTIKDVLIEDDGRVSEYWIRKRTLGFLRRLLKVNPDDLSAAPGGVAVVNRTSDEEVLDLTP